MSNDEQVMRYINPEHMVSVALNSMRVVEINGIPCNRIDEAAFISAINKRDTALLAPHLAKIKELESDLEECGQLLVDSNELLRQNLPTIQHYEAKIKRLEEAFQEIENACGCVNFSSHNQMREAIEATMAIAENALSVADKGADIIEEQNCKIKQLEDEIIERTEYMQKRSRKAIELGDKLFKTQIRNKALEDTLWFYGDLAQYEGISLGVSPLNNDRGEKARTVLLSETTPDNTQVKED